MTKRIEDEHRVIAGVGRQGAGERQGRRRCAGDADKILTPLVGQRSRAGRGDGERDRGTLDDGLSDRLGGNLRGNAAGDGARSGSDRDGQGGGDRGAKGVGRGQAHRGNAGCSRGTADETGRGIDRKAGREPGGGIGRGREAGRDTVVERRAHGASSGDPAGNHRALTDGQRQGRNGAGARGIIGAEQDRGVTGGRRRARDSPGGGVGGEAGRQIADVETGHRRNDD